MKKQQPKKRRRPYPSIVKSLNDKGIKAKVVKRNGLVSSDWILHHGSGNRLLLGNGNRGSQSREKGKKITSALACERRTNNHLT